ncbi:DUF6185 family protein (plasmid) [Streptomyces cynarae]|uniref:DUF6185 family protein n=1 Tax=Streptomyces cynarae TaxID=2981134 RepID=A0ABY6EEL5_9ACTN|nr:DUF6185 family protein [Streptomyces cynarae]UXY25105.1 DUF6185 family protein [Streptomyces cynarae]
MILAIACRGYSSAEAQNGAPDPCMTNQLSARVANAEIDFNQHARTHVQVQSKMTIKVPETAWPLAKDLMLGSESSKYRTAMRCLLREGENIDGNLQKNPRNAEWRFRNPQVTAKDNLVTVRYDALAWVKTASIVQIGPWEINAKESDKWKVYLRPPKTLEKARWEHIEVKLGGLNTGNIKRPAVSASKNSLVWAAQPPQNVEVDVDPPWQRTLALHTEQSFWSTVGVASWWVCASAVIALAALRLRRKALSDQSGQNERDVQVSTFQVSGANKRCHESSGKALFHWSGLSTAVALAVLLLISHPVISVPSSWRALISIAAAVTLALVARPWCQVVVDPDPHTGAGTSANTKAGVDEPASPGAGTDTNHRDVRSRQARVIIATVSAVAVIGLLVVLAPHLFGLQAELKPEAPLTVSRAVGLTLLGLATLWLWLAAMAAWGWRFALEGGLVRSSWTSKWNHTPARWVALVGVLLAVVAGAMFSCFWWANEHQWRRVTWLLDQTSSNSRDINISKFLVMFPFTGLTWLYAYTWVLTGIALIAFLRVEAQRSRTGGVEYALWPDGKAEGLLTAAVFAFVVGLRNVPFAGSIALYGVWLPLNIASLCAVVTLGRRWSVLGFRVSNDGMGTQPSFPVRRLGSKWGRHELLKKAHQYRSLQHQLYLVDHGRIEGVTREQLETKLHELHEWLIAGCGEGHPPDQDSVLDVALAWGPEDHWWDNARHAGRLAFYFGIPASAALVWLTHLKDYQSWILTLHDPIGFPEILANLLTYQAAWAGAGFVMGALWRLLPGRRGPVRALAITAAFAIPVCLGALLSRITDTDLGYAFLTVLLMLTILTLTSMWMDSATFTEERQLWPTRFGLLLSVYQLRGLSAQIAYLLGQVSIAVGIWVQLASAKSLPPVR